MHSYFSWHLRERPGDGTECGEDMWNPSPCPTPLAWLFWAVEMMSFEPQHQHSSQWWGYGALRAVHTNIFSRFPLQKVPPKQSTMKRKINTSKSYLQLIREMEQELSKDFLSACKTAAFMPSTSKAYTEIPMARRHFLYILLELVEHLGNKEKTASCWWPELTLGMFDWNVKKETFAHEGVQWEWKCLCCAGTPSVLYQASEAIDKNECHITISPPPTLKKITIINSY